jgi:hypothetical protein
MSTPSSAISMESIYNTPTSSISIDSIGIPKTQSPLDMSQSIPVRPSIPRKEYDEMFGSKIREKAYNDQRAEFTKPSAKELRTEAAKQFHTKVSKLEQMGIPAAVATSHVAGQPVSGIKAPLTSTYQNIKNALSNVYQKVSGTGGYAGPSILGHIAEAASAASQSLATVNPARAEQFKQKADFLNYANKHRPTTFGRVKAALGFKKGGRVPKSGKYLVHKKEFIVKKGSKISKSQKKAVAKRKK